MTKYDLRILGYDKDGDVLAVSEEERTHTHIIAGTGEGKSKHIEKNCQLDIDRIIKYKDQPGFAVLDATDQGATARSVLKYCIHRGYEKVCLIDPVHYYDYKRVAAISPFKFRPDLKWTSISSVNNTLQVTSEIRDPAQTKRIQRYLRAVLSVLWDAKCALSDIEYFTDFENAFYKLKRREILNKVDDLDRHRIAVEWGFKNSVTYRDFETTVRRVEDLLDDPLKTMFSFKEGINFTKMIRNGWVILVNLDADGPLEPIHTRLLGTAIINEILGAIHRIRRRTPEWNKPYHLYIDEGADFANRRLGRVLSHKGKTGLKVTLAHQYFAQFEDRWVLDSITNNCKTKVMFDIEGPEDRDKMAKMFYGGEISIREASFANADLPKQTMVYKAPKKRATRYRHVDCITPPIPEKIVRDFIKTKLLNFDWNYPVEETKAVYYETQPSYEPPRRSNQPSEKTSKAAHRPTSKAPAPRRAPNTSAKQPFALDGLPRRRDYLSNGC